MVWQSVKTALSFKWPDVSSLVHDSPNICGVEATMFLLTHTQSKLHFCSLNHIFLSLSYEGISSNDLYTNINGWLWIKQPNYKPDRTHLLHTDLLRSSSCLTLHGDFWGHPENSNIYNGWCFILSLMGYLSCL
jgi:hypothetical protein